MASEIRVKLTSTGYYHARGVGPCEWAQWRRGASLTDDSFFPEASEHFRRALRRWLEDNPPPTEAA